MEPRSEVRVDRQVLDGVVVVRVVGEVDGATTPEVLQGVMAGIDQASGHCCIADLAGVSFLGSPGLAMLVTVAQHASSLGGELRIVIDRDQPVIRPAQITGLIDVLALYHSVDEALAGVDRPSG